MTKRLTTRHKMWFFSAVMAPLLLVGGLLGAGASAENALERIPVALVNNDELLTEIDDDGEETFILASRPVVTELVTNDDLELNWIITDTERATAMLASGEVYAVLEIPQNFSQAVSTLDSAIPEQASFTIRTDPSRSYLAGVLAEALGESLAATISAEFGKEITRGFGDVIVDLGDAFGVAAEAAREVADGTQSLLEGVAELADGVSDLNTGTADLARGYATFDDGLGEYLTGVRSLSDGLGTFERETRGLPGITTGVTEYTQGVAGVSGGLASIDFSGTADPRLGPLLGALAELAAGGPTLAGQTGSAITGVREGIVGIDSGARALATAGDEVRSGSSEIRSGVRELAQGVGDLDEGVGDLVEGVEELNEGIEEFAEGLESGAAEFDEQGIADPTDALLSALVSPVIFDSQGGEGNQGLQATLASVLIPIGLWLVTLVYFLMTPPLPPRMWASTAPTGTLVARSLRPMLSVLGAQVVVVTLLFHTLGAVAWSLVPWTAPIIALGAAAFAGLHYALWMWKARWLAPVSLTFAVAQIVTVGAVVPLEVLPRVYQILGGATPLAWATDALVSVVAGADASRIVASMFFLVVAAAAGVILGRIVAGRLRVPALRSELSLNRDELQPTR